MGPFAHLHRLRHLRLLCSSCLPYFLCPLCFPCLLCLLSSSASSATPPLLPPLVPLPPLPLSPQTLYVEGPPLPVPEFVLQWTPPPPPPPRKKGEKRKDVPRRYQCDLCPMAFQRPSALEQHINTHTGAKPYVCERCGRGFSFRTNLMRHERLYLQSGGSLGPSTSFASAKHK
ncbi:hypothetical protein BS47DRAFT_371826 [Hydnum rufescens UP504]|uniref:C2H2-type domain-containing protein n=1 Tax=Hydnum rufescens UP504 TaxID=1448309 RepID=A0A9P6B5G4_9AGAM|nr:hypothetical protein BS47DRAFT_371826 [Hydnum rufescens UP504]